MKYTMSQKCLEARRSNSMLAAEANRVERNLEWFDQWVLKSEGCWEWQSSKNHKGYGKFSISKRVNGERIVTTHLAHRFSYQLNFGAIPDGLWVLHHCDNPACVRPDHLFLGTALINAADRDAKGRWKDHWNSK